MTSCKAPESGGDSGVLVAGEDVLCFGEGGDAGGDEADLVEDDGGQAGTEARCCTQFRSTLMISSIVRNSGPFILSILS